MAESVTAALGDLGPLESISSIFQHYSGLFSLNGGGITVLMGDFPFPRACSPWSSGNFKWFVMELISGHSQKEAWWWVKEVCPHFCLLE
jgi:hypothetical protein